MRRWCVAAVVIAAGCASAPIRKADLPDLNRADAAVLEGCYDCLIDARTIYTRLAVGRARPLLIGRLFETEVLLALRERELAIDPAGTFARARALAAELPPTVDGSRVLALASAVPADPFGTPRRDAAEFRRAQAPLLKSLPQELVWLESTTLAPHVRQYLALSLDCAYRPGARQPARGAVITAAFDAPRPQLAIDAPPLLRYRQATCERFDNKALETLLAAVPRFVEANYPLGRNAVALVQQRGDLARTRGFVSTAFDRFPQSASIAYLNGSFNQTIGDCRAALEFYDRTLAVHPVHEDALLGRTACLTFLKRTDDAIATATQMIDVKTDNLVEAFYWRAWNHHFGLHLTPARADIERAKALAVNLRIYTLAGVIEHDQDDLDPAEKDLRVATTLSGGDRNCTGFWYLGLVHMKREKWVPSGDAFERAMRCYDLNVQENLESIEKMRKNPDIDEEFRARQIAGFEAALAEDRRQYHAAAFNAANHYARGGLVDKARPLIDVAAKDPTLASRVADLLRAIGG